MFSFNERVRYSETNESLELSYVALVNYFQDACLFEAEMGKANMAYLKENDIAWLLGAWQIQIERMPHFNEEVRISTIPYEFKGFLGYRNFILEDAKGNVLAKANSIWTLVDMNKLKPLRITDDFKMMYQLGDKIDMDYKNRKIIFEGEGCVQKSRRVHKSQIDSNQHMNNSQYINMALEFLPADKTVKEIRVEYRTAAYLDDEIIPVIYQGENTVQVDLRSTNDSSYAYVEISY